MKISTTTVGPTQAAVWYGRLRGHVLPAKAAYKILNSRYFYEWLVEPSQDMVRSTFRTGRIKYNHTQLNVKAVSLYTSEFWTITQRTMYRMQVFINKCLRGICNIHWPDRIANKELWRNTNRENIDKTSYASARNISRHTAPVDAHNSAIPEAILPKIKEDLSEMWPNRRAKFHADR